MSLTGALLTNWHMLNQDTSEELEGDFEAQDVTRNVSSAYIEHFALSRQSPITQYLHGNVKTLSFTGRFFADPAILSITGLPFAGPVPFLPAAAKAPGNRFSLRPSEKLAKLEAWTDVDPELLRPPIVQFTIGNGELSQTSVIESISNIRYDRPLLTGEVRGVTFTVNLRHFVPFDMETASEPFPDTRYHHVTSGEYYELVAEREYGFPLLGDLVRKRHPRQAIVHEGNIVALPPVRAIQHTPITPQSIVLKNVTSDAESPQGQLKQVVLDRLNKTKFSTVIPDGI